MKNDNNMLTFFVINHLYFIKEYFNAISIILTYSKMTYSTEEESNTISIILTYSTEE